MVFIRDRTNLFVSYRQSYTHQQTSYTDLDKLEGEDDALISEVDVGIPPQWLELSQQLDQALEKIENQIVQLKPLHKQNSLPGLDDRTHLSREIEVITISITKGLHRCQSLVKSFAEIANLQRDNQLKKMATNIQISMAAKLQDVSTDFRQMQSRYLKALQQDELGELPGFLKTSNSTVSLNAPTTIEDDVQLSQMTIQQHNPESWEDAEVAQREQGINQVADSILEVADIFRDLQTMVIDQGALVDRIDYNVDRTLVDMKGTNRELIKGEQYQKRTAKCKIIFLLILVVVGLILVLIFKPRSHE